MMETSAIVYTIGSNHVLRHNLWKGKEVKGMKKALSERALAEEAALWDRLKKAARENPAKVCHK